MAFSTPSREDQTLQGLAVSQDPRDHPEADSVLTEATLRAADLLGLKNAELAAILGVNRSTVSRWQNPQNSSLISAKSKTGEAAALFIRMIRSLSTFFAGEFEQCGRWLRSDNSYFDARPIDLIKTSQGLVRVCDYLDAMRGH